jgi:acyl-CoA synthetase (AMP-forming)/AMP-acid ligase II
VPDARLGEVGRAYATPRLGPEVSPDKLIAWCRERMTNYKVPRSVVVTARLPGKDAGKISKSDLRERVRSS